MYPALLITLALPLLAFLEAGASDVPFVIPEVKPPAFADRTFDIRDYGAVADGKASNTQAFAKAIGACCDAGGGRVVVPAGDWLTGPIHLKSNVDLHLEKGAQILFSTNRDEYLPPVFSRWEGMECYIWSPLIYANGCTNIAVTGDGTLNGQGEAWWPLNEDKKPSALKLYEMAVNGTPVKDRVFASDEQPLRPSFVQPINCSNVLIEGVTLVNGPMWTIHPVYSENVLVRQVNVRTKGPNTDGIVPDSCRNVVIDGCSFSTGDDCIVIKSGLNEEGWKVGMPSENILVRNCHTERGHGGVVIGSEMSGGVRNVVVQNCDFTGTERGIRMKSMRGRGATVENIYVRGLKLDRIPNEVVQINMFYGSSTIVPKTQTPPTFRNITIRDVKCKQANRAIELIGLPESALENVTLENMDIAANKGAYLSDVKGITLRGVRIAPSDGPVVHIVNGSGVSISGTKCSDGTDPFLKVQGERSSDIRVTNCDLSGATQAVVKDADVPEGAVTLK